MCIEFSKKLGILIHTWLPIVVANAPLFKTGNRNHCSAAIFSKKEWWVSVWPPVREPWDEEEEMEAGKVAGNLKLWWWTCILNDSDDDANFFYFFKFFFSVFCPPPTLLHYLLTKKIELLKNLLQYVALSRSDRSPPSRQQVLDRYVTSTFLDSCALGSFGRWSGFLPRFSNLDRLKLTSSQLRRTIIPDHVLRSGLDCLLAPSPAESLFLQAASSVKVSPLVCNQSKVCEVLLALLKWRHSHKQPLGGRKQIPQVFGGGWCQVGGYWSDGSGCCCCCWQFWRLKALEGRSRFQGWLLG